MFSETEYAGKLNVLVLKIGGVKDTLILAYGETKPI